MEASGTKGERVGRCRLTLTINGADYDVRPIASEMDDVSRAFRLTHDGNTYDVAQTIHGPTCDCPDFIFRREWVDPRGCLHIRVKRVKEIL